MIQTERLYIRPFEEKDRDVAIKLLQDPDFMEYSDTGPLDTNAANDRFDQILLYSKSGAGKSAIILREDGIIIGYCGVEPFDLDGKKEFELGYRLVSSFRGMGFATEAAKAISNTHSGRLYAYLDRKNLKSINVLKKIGFSHQGVCDVKGKQYELYQKNT